MREDFTYIAVVDDDADIRNTLAQILEMEGYRVVSASDGLEALERLRTTRGRCALILLDLMMPVMDGWQFREAQLADARLSDIPVVLVSAGSDLVTASRELQVAEALSKPLDIETILEVVWRHAGAASNYGSTGRSA